MKKLLKRSTQMLAFILTAAMLVTGIPTASFAAGIKDSDWYVQKQVEKSIPEKEEETPAEVANEIVEKRTENEKHFRLKDGTSAVALYDYPVHYEDESGGWQEYDNTLVAATDAQGQAVYKNQSSPVSVGFAKNSSAAELVTLQSENGAISWNVLQKSRSSTASEFQVYDKPAALSLAEDEKAKQAMAVENVMSEGTYADIFPDVDLQYIVQSNIVKENIILKTKDTPNAYSFAINHAGLSLRIEEDGSLTFYNPEQPDVAVYTFVKPFASDANGAITEDVHFSADIGDDSSIITITASEEWLRDSGRAYPVVIDPYTKPEAKSSNIMDTFVRQSSPNSGVVGTYGSFVVGKNYSDGVCRSLVKFNNLPQLNNGDIIYDARLSLVQYEYSANDGQPFNIGAYEPLSSWNEGTTTWNNQPAADANVLDYTEVNNSISFRYLNITKLVRQWYNTGVNNGVMLKSMSENKYAVTRFFTSDYPFNQPGNYEGGPSYYPTGVFYYKNATGLEDYWSYHEQAAGTAGTVYTNDFNGNLTLIHNDASTSDPLMAAAVNHVYNLSESETSSRFGNGWNINVMQRFEPNTGVSVETFPYVYTDGDGTRHYFYNDNGTYKDEDGLGMVYRSINEGELRFQVSLKDKTTLKFDMWYNLRRVVDMHGNTVSYNHGPSTAGNYIGSMSDASGNMIYFEYNSDLTKLTEIRDEAGRKILYSYDGAGNLTKVTYPDGSSSKYAYDGKKLIAAESSDGYRMEYQYTSDMRIPRVARITEKDAAGNYGQELQISYSNGCTTLFEDGGADGVLATTGDNNRTTYNFDRFGRLNDVYDKDSNAASAEYYNEDAGNAKNNKLQAQSALNKTTTSYVKNGRFNSGTDGWSAKEYDPNLPFTATLNTDDGYDDKACMKVKRDGAYSTAGFSQTSPRLPGGAYTLSGYLKTEGSIVHGDEVNEGAGVMLDVYNSAGQFTGRKMSEYVMRTDHTTLENGWQRVSVTMDVPEGGYVYAFAGIFNAKGAAYFDNIQLEAGDTPSACNMMNNGSFEFAKSNGDPDGWGVSKSTGRSDCVSGGKFGANQIIMSSQPGKQNRISQAIDVKPGPEGDVFTISGWAKGVSPNKGWFRLAAAVLYTNHDPIWHTIDFDTSVTNWQYGSLTFSTDDNDSSTDLTYTAIHVYIFYEDNMNEMSFDGIQLLKDSGQSYVYDKNGNLVSAKSAADDAKFTYTGSSDLAKLVDVTGTEFKYQYSDVTGDLISASNSDGLNYSFDYDDKGNATGSSVSGKDQDAAPKSGKTYYIRNLLTGKYLSVSGALDNDGTNVNQHELFRVPNQRWKIESTGDGYYRLLAGHSTGDRVLNIDGISTADGANVSIWKDVGQSNQRFQLKLLGTGCYQILPKHAGGKKAVMVADNSFDNNSNVEIGTAYDDNPIQSWIFELAETDGGKVTEEPTPQVAFKFRSRQSGHYLNIFDYDGYTGNQYLFSNIYGGLAALKLEDAGGGYFNIVSNTNPDMALSQYGTSYQGEAQFSLRPKDAADENQKFQFIPATGEYAIRCKGTQSFIWQQSGSTIGPGSGAATDTANRWVLETQSVSRISTSATYKAGTNKMETQTDARGNTVSYTYGSGNRLLTSTEAAGQKTNYTYDANTDRITSVADGNNMGVKTEYSYDKGALKQIRHNGFAYNLTYDGFGNTIKTSVGSQTLSENAYDARRGVLTKSTYGNGDYVDYAYDAKGNVSRVKTETGANDEYRYQYDSQNNLISVGEQRTGKTTKFDFDFIGRPIRVKSSDGHVMKTKYDAKNRVDSFSTEVGGLRTAVQYVYGDQTKEQVPSVVYGVNINEKQTLSYQYDNLTRLSQRKLHTTKPYFTAYSYVPGSEEGKTSTLLQSVNNNGNAIYYTYDAAGNILSITENNVLKYSYTYDVLNQLVSEVDETSGLHTEYTYDVGGNMTQKTTFTLNAAGGKENVNTENYVFADTAWKDKLTSYNGTAISYDEIGNPLNWRDGMNFTWKNGRQLATAQTANNSLLFQYNESGIRTEKTTAKGTTKYYLSGSIIMTQSGPEGRLDFFHDDTGNLLGLVYNGKTYYYIRNGQNDITGILDATGAQVVSYAYDSWGKLLSVTGDEAETIGVLNPFRYRGYYYDSETTLYYLNSRYYDPQAGRFMNADFALGVNGDLISNNLFIYCSDNPISYQDPSGNGKIKNFFKKVAKAIVTIVRNAATTQLRNSMLISGPQTRVSQSVSPNGGVKYKSTSGSKMFVQTTTGVKTSVTKTVGKKKGFNYYYSNSDGASGLGAQVGPVSYTQSWKKATISLEVANGVSGSFSLGIPGDGTISLTTSVSSTVGDVMETGYTTVDVNIGMMILAVAVFVTAGPYAQQILESVGGELGYAAQQ